MLRHGGNTKGRRKAAAVTEASGAWSTPSPIGGDGLPTLGEPAASEP
ncbi:hypothetical protein [Streptomyces sp. H34-S4]|nr:hypothetical protein [Streptomyces sp. H34-S4]MCY0935464.1 hypothetical protein [Streptomyces sp. H34-S4]